MALTSVSLPTQIKRVMLFIDGKNLAVRYKSLRDSGRKSFGEVKEIRDTFVWIPLLFQYPKSLSMGIESYDIVRGYYFTYFVGADDAIEENTKIIKGTQIKINSQQTFSPCVIKKDSNEKAAKGDDIKLTVMALHHAFHQHMDIMHLFTGDGDYIPLIEEVQRLGIRVYVSAFSSGLNDKLKLVADEFFELDNFFYIREQGDNPVIQ